MSKLSHQLLTTKQLPGVTGLSESFFAKGRIYGFGPPFIRIRTGQRAGKILYRVSDVERWLTSQEQTPRGAGDE